MAKALKAGLRAALTVAVVALGATLIPFVAISSATIIASAAVAGVGAFINTLLTKPIDATVENFGTKVAGMSPIAPRQVVYGLARVGGTIVYMDTKGGATDKPNLHLIVAIAGHEIQSIEKIFLNNVELTTTTSDISGETVYTVTNSDFTNTDNENNHGSGRLIRYVQGLGADNQDIGGYTIAQTDFTADHDLKGVAYVHFHMIYDQSKLASVPSISFEIKGKKLFDPRDDTTAWTTNPALIVRDMLTDTRYGLRATSDEINDNSSVFGNFETAADDCEVPVNDKDGTDHDTYQANGFYNATTPIGEALQGVLSACAGKLTYVNGKFNILVGKTQSPDLTITDNDLIGEIQLSNSTDLANIYNTVKPIYVDLETNYTSKDSALRKEGENDSGTTTNFLTQDTPSGATEANFQRIMEMKLPFVTNDSQAQRLGKIALNYQRRTKIITVNTTLKFLQLAVGDWVYVTNSRLSFSSKKFEVLSATTASTTDENPIIYCQLTLKEVDNHIFDFDPASDYITGTQNDYSGPTPVTLGAPTSVSASGGVNIQSDGTSVGFLIVNWTNASNATIDHTEIQIRKTSTFGDPQDFKTVDYPQTTAQISGLEVGATYYVRLRHKGPTGVLGTFSSVVNASITADTTAPDQITDLTATTDVEGTILVRWTNPDNNDLRSIKVYRKTTNVTPTDDTNLVTTISGEPNKSSSVTQGVEENLSPNTNYYFWVRAVDYSGNEGTISSSATGKFLPLTDDVIGGGGGGFFLFSVAGNTNAPSDSAFNTQEGRLPKNNDIVRVLDTTNNVSKAYKYSGQTANSLGGGGSFSDAGDLIAGDLIVATSKIQAGELNSPNSGDTNVALLDGKDSLYRIYAGGIGGNAPFNVKQDGSVTARSLTLKKSDGTTYFDSTNGFTAEAISQIASSLNTRVQTFAFTASENYDSGDDTTYLEITTTDTTTVSLKVIVDLVEQMSGSGSTEAICKDQFPDDITLTIQYASDSAFTSPTTVGSTQTFTKDTNGTVTSSEYEISTIDLSDFGGTGFNGFISPNTGAVDTNGEITYEPADFSLSAGTYYFRVTLGSTDTGHDQTGETNSPVDLSRILEIEDTTGNGFTVNNAQTSGAQQSDAVLLAGDQSISGTKTFTGSLVVSGTFQTTGSSTTIDSTNTTISDALIELNNGGASVANTNDLGLILERGTTGDNGFIGFDESIDYFRFATTTATGASTGDLTLTDAKLRVGTLNLSGTDVSATATELNKLDGATLSTTELNYVTGVTSAIQTQLDAKYQANDNISVGTIGSGDITITDTSPKLRLTDSDTGADSDVSASSANGSLFLSADSNNEVANTILGFQVDGSTKFYVGTDGFYAVNQKIIDASTRNLVNIGTIDSGAITSSGDLAIDTDTLFVDVSTDRVGINNNSPSYPLDFPTNQSGLTIRVGDDNVTSYMAFSNPRGMVGFDNAGYMTLQGGASKGVRLNVNNSTFGSGAALTIDTSANATFAGTINSGNINIGTADTTQGTLTIHGSGTGSDEGGELRLATAADHDSTYNFYRLDVYQDDLRIGREGTTDITLNSSGNANFNARLDIGTPPVAGQTGQMLHIQQENNSTTTFRPQLELYADLNTTSTYNNLGSITFSSNDRQTTQQKLDFAEIRGFAENRDTVATNGNNDGQIRFLVRNQAGLGEKLRITHDEVEVYTTLKTINGGVTLSYPTSDGTNGQALTTDGSGNLTFSSISGTTINNNADNRVITGSGTANTLNGEANLTFDGSTLSVTGTISSGQLSATTSADATPAIIATNSGGVNGIIQRWVGDSDSLEVQNLDEGDYFLTNTQQDNGIIFRDGTGGLEFRYNNSTVMQIDSGGGVKLQTGSYKIGNTIVIDTNRSLQNIVNGTFSGNITVGDGHTIGDDVNDNLEIASSTGENILINSANQVYLQTGGTTKLETKSDGVDITGELQADSLDIDGSSNFAFTNTNAGVQITHTDNVAAQDVSTLYIDHNLSGSDATTGADYTHRGIFVDLDSSATGGDTTDEHRVRGIDVDVRASGDSDIVTGIRAYTESQHSSGEISALYGIDMQTIVDDTGTARTTNAFGVQSTIQLQNTGSGGGTATYPIYGKTLYSTGSDKNQTSGGHGVYGEIEVDDAGQAQTISGLQKVFNAVFDNDGGSNITISGRTMLYAGDYQGTIPSDAYNIYLVSDAPSYIEGKLGLGRIPTQKLDVDGSIGINGTEIVTSARALTNIGTITATQGLSLNASGTNDTSIEIGANTTSNHYAFIDLVGDATYTDYGLRIIRNNGGANTSSFIYHRGTGNFNIETQDSAAIKLRTAGTDALTIDTSQNTILGGNLSIGGTSTNSSYGIWLQGNKWYATQYSSSHDVVRFNANTNGELDFYNQTDSAYAGVRAGLYRIGTTTVIDGSRNLTNIGTYSGSGDMTISKSTTPTLTIETSVTSGQDAFLVIRGARTSSSTSDIGLIKFDNKTSSPYTLGVIRARDPSGSHTLGRGSLTFSTSSGGTLSDALVLGHDQSATFSGTISSGDITASSTSGATLILEDSGSHNFKIVCENGSNFLNIKEGGNTSILTVDGSNQRVGIGTTSPSQKLHIVGGNGNYFPVQFSGDSGGTGYLYGDSGGSGIFNGTTISTSEGMYMDSGNSRTTIYANGGPRFGVYSDGIRLFNTSGYVRADNIFQFLTLSGGAQASKFKSVAAQTSYSNGALDGMFNALNGYAVGTGTGTTVIDSSRNLTNIGTISSGAITVTADAGNEQFVIKRASNTNEQLILGFHSSDYATIQAVEQNVSFRNLYLQPSGANVGIGAASASYTLDVNGTFAFRSTGYAYDSNFYAYNSGSGTYLRFGNDGSSGLLTMTGAQNLSIQGQGGGQTTIFGILNVGGANRNGRNMIEIQTNDNTADRGIAFRNSANAYSNVIFAENVGGNDARLVFTCGNSTTNIANVQRSFMIDNQSGGGGVSGDIHARGDVVAFSSTISSDERLKYDIEDIKNPLDIIQSLKGRHFKWKKNDQQSSGVIAQEVEQSEMSFLVSDKVDIDNPDETIKRVKYDGFIGVLIEAIKEQQKQIDELKAKLK